MEVGGFRTNGVSFSGFKYERVGISLVGVFKRVAGNLSFGSVKGLRRANR